MAEVKKEHRELAANTCFTRPISSDVESYVAGDRVTYHDGSLFACMVAFAHVIADAEERSFAAGREAERESIWNYADAAFPNSRAVKTLVKDIRRGEHARGLNELHVGAAGKERGDG